MRGRTWSYEKIEKLLKQGRGQGEFSEYTPWIKIYDLSSKGYNVRIQGIKSRRTHHFLSHLEYAYFLVLSYQKDVIDIREQFPLLDVTAAINIAEEKGIRYPKVSKTGVPYILTTDFFITVNSNNENKYVARTIKPSSELTKKRVLEKFEIEREYWQQRGVDWGIITEKELPSHIYINNLKALYNSHLVLSRTYEEAVRIDLISQLLQRLVRSKQILRDELIRNDSELSLKNGTSLSLFYYLVFHHVINLDLYRKIDVCSIECSEMNYSRSEF